MKAGFKKTIGVLLLVLCCLGMFPAAAKAKDVVIVLDPGHGGAEAGATRTWSGVTYREEIINLKIAQYAKKELETYKGVKVYLTRSTNSGPSMDRSTRVNFAKSKKATALVSIHINSTGEHQTSSSGCMAMVPSPGRYPNSLSYAKNSRTLANAILKQLRGTGLVNRGFLYDDELGIILYGMKAKIPSMIIEHCFVNNPSDCKKYLKSEASLKKLGVADATGIAKCLKLSKTGSSGSADSGEKEKNGWYKVASNGKKRYYKDGVRVESQWMNIKGKYYYFDRNGYLQTGVFKIGSSMYLSDENGVRQKGLVKYKNKWYYANSKGKLYTNWRTIKGKKYYFSKSNGAAYTGLKTISGQKYYFSKTTGAMQKRWVTISGKKYYFSSNDGRMLKKRWLKRTEGYYYLSSSGYAYTNTRKKIGSKTYKFNKSGICTNR